MKFNKILLTLAILLLLLSLSSFTVFAEGEVALSFEDGKGNQLTVLSGEVGQVITLPKGEDYAPLGSEFSCWEIGEEKYQSESEYTLAESVTVKGVFLTHYSGDGSAENPYLVYTAKGLSTLFVAGNEDKHFVLKADLDFADLEFISFSELFTGTFDGEGHKIKNLKMTSGATLGFIPKMQNARITNVVFEDATITLTTEADRYSAGVVCGQAKSCVFENIQASGEVVYGKGTAGGIGGKISGNSTLTQVISQVDVTANMAGGIGGEISQESTLTHCANLGSITASSCVGGIGGEVSGALYSVANYGAITCSTDYGVVAGIVGLASESCIIDKAFNGAIPQITAGGAGEVGVIFVAEDFSPTAQNLYCLEGVGAESDSLTVISEIQGKTTLLSLLDEEDNWGVSNQINSGYPVPKCLYDIGDITLTNPLVEGKVEKVFDGSEKGIDLVSSKCDSFTFYYQGEFFNGTPYPLCSDMPTQGGNYTVYAISNTQGVLGFFTAQLKIKKALLVESGYYMTDDSKVYTSTPLHITILNKDGEEPDWMEITGSYPFYSYEIQKDGEWVSITAEESVNVGTYRVTATIDGGNNFENIENKDLNALLTILPAPLYAKADDKSVVFGDDLPDFGVSVWGFLGEDTPQNSKGYVAPTAYYFTEGVENPYYAGVYEGSIKIAERGYASNYTFYTQNAEGEYVYCDGEYIPYQEELHSGLQRYGYNGTNGTLTITPRVISGLSFDIPSFVYDGAPHGGEVNGELPEGATVLYSYKVDGEFTEGVQTPLSFTNAGSYIIRAVVSAPNYQDLVMDRELIIEKGEFAHLTFTSQNFVFNGENNKIEIKGELPEGVEVVYSVDGGEEVAELYLINAGEYQCVARVKESANYRELVLSCKVEIQKLQVLIIVDDINAVYGDQLVDAYTFTVYGSKGLIPLEDKSLLGLNPTCVCDRENKAGVYAIIPSVDSQDNHQVEIEEGRYTIAKKELVLSLDPHAIPYGEEIGEFEILYQGFVEGDGPQVLDTLPQATVDAEKGSEVGDYPISLTLPEDDNYILKYPYVCYLTIKKAYAKIQGFGDKKVTYDGNAQSILPTQIPEGATVVYTYSQKGEVIGSFDSLGNMEGLTALGVCDAGVYSVEAVIAGSKNYYEFRANATLEIKQAKVILITPSLEITYGSEYITPSLTVESAVNSEKVIEDLAATYLCDFTPESPVAVGVYPIQISFTPNPNYEVSVIEGSYTLSKAVLTAKLSIESVAFGQAYPTPQISYQGFVEGDDETSLITAPSVVGMPSPFANAGSYPLSLQGGESENYTFQYVGTTFLILRADYSYLYTLKGLETVYDGQAKNLALTWADESREGEPTFPVGIHPVYQGNGKVDKGVYTVTATLGGDENHVLTTYTATLTILPKQVAVEGVLAQDKNYDGKTNVLLYGGSLQGVLPEDVDFVGFTLGEGNTGDKKAEEDKAVYTNLLLTGEKAYNYQLCQPDYVTVSIHKIPLSILGIEAIDRRYNQSEVVNLDLSDLSFVGVVEGDSVALSQESIGILTDLSIGEKVVTVDGQTLVYQGEDYLNYILQPIDYVTVNITTGSLFTAPENIFVGTNGALQIINPDFAQNSTYTQQGIVMNNLQFDGSTFLCEIFANLPKGVTARVSGEGIEATEKGFKARNAGKYSLVLEIDGGGVYASESLPLTFEILAKEITISEVSAITRPYDGTTDIHLEGGKLVGVMGDDRVSFVLNIADASNKNVGENIAITTHIALEGEEASNYILIQPTLTCTIIQKTLTIEEVTPLTRPYDATTQIALEGGKLVGVVSGEEIGFDLGIATSQSANAGENIPLTTAITLKGAGFENYTLTQPTLTANITKKVVVVKGDSFTIYSNQPLPEFTYTVEGFLNDDGLTGSLALDVEKVVMNKDYVIGLGTLACGDNYQIEYHAGVLTVKIPVYVWVVVALAGAILVGVAVLLVVLKKRKAPKPISDGKTVDTISVGEKAEEDKKDE